MTWVSWVNLLLGLWLIISPWALGYAALSNIPTGAAVALGVAVASIAVWGVTERATPTPGWTNLMLGVLILFAPVVLGYWSVSMAATNHVIVGLLVAIFGATRATASRRVTATGGQGRV